MTDKNLSKGSLGNNTNLVGMSGTRLKAAALVAGLSIVSTTAYAGSSYERARVVSSTPVYQTVVYEEPREVCRQERVAYQESAHRSKTPGIIGAIVGGALGNAVGKQEVQQAGGYSGWRYLGLFHRKRYWPA